MVVTITALNVVGDHRVLTVKGAARNSEGVDGSDPVGLRVYSRDAGVIGHAENDTGPVATFTSTDPENGRPGQGIDWDVTGVDAADFLIDARGTLIFRRPADHEFPTDRARSDVDVNGDGDTDDTGEVAVTGDDNMYQITLRATEQMTGGPDDRAFTAESSRHGRGLRRERAWRADYEPAPAGGRHPRHGHSERPRRGYRH